MQSDHMALMGQAAIDGVDAVANECERVWGVGRLRLIVPVELRAKFDAQLDHLDTAIREADITELSLQCAKTCFAWRSLHNAAVEAGCQALSPDVWEVGLPDGTVAAIVRSSPEAHAVVREGRRTQVYTLSEIAQLIHGFPQLVRAKEVWPGAEVVRAGSRSQVFDDEIPRAL
jgi:hypothetical protein